MPVETKVSAASVASTLAGLVVMLLATLVFHGGAVPALLVSLVGALATGAVTFGAGWAARHTPRPLKTTDTGSSAPLTTAAPTSASSAAPRVDTSPPAAPPSAPLDGPTPPAT